MFLQPGHATLNLGNSRVIEITKTFVQDKAGILSYYRNRAAESLQEVCRLYAASQKESRA